MEKRKILKSKKISVVIAIALMLCLIGGMGAMTYSKYVTSENTGPQNATAAKWGYVISIDSSNLFGTDYIKGSTTNTATVVEKGTGVAVKATGNTSVIAPGTSGSIQIRISGSAEVLAQLKITANLTSEISLDTYKPVKWTITGDGIDNSNNIFTTGNEYEFANTLNTGASNNLVYTISWEWGFENDNTKDTLIGYKANGTNYDALPAKLKNTVEKNNYDNINLTLELDLTATIEQIQKNN